MKKLLLFMFFGISVGLNAQTIQNVSPNTGDIGQTLVVTITGENTQFSSVSSTQGISFYNSLSQHLVVNAIQLVSETVILASVTIPTSVSSGVYNLSVYNANDFNVYGLANAFTVTNNYNIIKGKVTTDYNSDGCDALDFHPQGVKIVINDGVSDSFTFTDSIGDYQYYAPAGNYTVTPQIDQTFYISTPQTATFNFATTSSLTEIQNFCITPNGVHNDLSMMIIPLAPARPGFDTFYELVYINNGNQVLSGSVNLLFDDTRLDYISSIVSPSSQTTNNLSWDFLNLMPFESRGIVVTLNVNSPMETPAVNLNDILNFTATANPIVGDETPNDNVAVFNQTVVGSYDPNDKAVTEGSQVSITEVDNYLHYVIRFQNTGTFPAEKVVVRDMLSDNLDKSTLEIISASHGYRSTLTLGNKLEFFFDNINLPPESTDEAGSNGFIAFKIKPSSTVGVGSVIENTAEIYFDFNFPIVTNTVSTTFAVLGNKKFDSDNEFLLYPNPVGSILNIDSQIQYQKASVKIFNQLGQLVKTIDNIGNSQNSKIEVGDLNTGTYFVQITTDKGTTVKKLIKK